jgi:hypothetical protein
MRILYFPFKWGKPRLIGFNTEFYQLSALWTNLWLPNLLNSFGFDFWPLTFDRWLSSRVLGLWLLVLTFWVQLLFFLSLLALSKSFGLLFLSIELVILLPSNFYLTCNLVAFAFLLRLSITSSHLSCLKFFRLQTSKLPLFFGCLSRNSFFPQSGFGLTVHTSLIPKEKTWV